MRGRSQAIKSSGVRLDSTGNGDIARIEGDRPNKETYSRLRQLVPRKLFSLLSLIPLCLFPLLPRMGHQRILVEKRNRKYDEQVFQIPCADKILVLKYSNEVLLKYSKEV